MKKTHGRDFPDKYRASFLVVTFLFIQFFANGQATYNPALAGTTSNKPYAPSQATPTDSRSYKYDSINFLWRVYNQTTEVLSYLNLPKYRTGQFIIYVNVGGSLQSNGTFIGGQIYPYWFLRGQADSQLVRLYSDLPPPGSGSVTTVSGVNSTGYTWSVTNPTTTPAIALTLAFGGDVSGGVNSTVVNRFNGQLPSFYQNYNNLFNTPTIPAPFNPIAGPGIALSGTAPNITFTATGGINTAGYGLIIGGGVVAIDSLRYRKQDTSFAVNDSTLEIKINGSPQFIQLRGGLHGSGPGAGTVTNFSFVNANGISGSVTNSTSIPALTLTLGNILPTTVNGLTLNSLTNGFSIVGGTTPATLTVPSNATVSGTNTGDITISGQNYAALTGQNIAFNPVDLSGSNATGVLAAGRFPALTGDITTSAGSLATALKTVISAGSCTNCNLTYDANGRLTVAANGSGGSGGTNSNVGAGYWIANAGTNNIKTFLSGYGGGWDSATTNVLRYTVDSTKFIPYTDTLKFNGIATISYVNSQGFIKTNAVTSVGGFSPLFTSSNTGAVTFTASNAAANTVFGNFTGSSAAPAFGKVNLASMATNTANTLLGYDASGNPVDVTAGTNITISAGVISASGGSGSFITNLGSGYRFVNYNSQGIKSGLAEYGILLDSATTNSIGFKLDTATAFAALRATIPGSTPDTILVNNIGAGIRTGYAVGTHTLTLKNLVSGTNISITAQADSSLLFNATDSAVVHGAFFTQSIVGTTKYINLSNQTASSLFGYNASGVPSVITLGTNLSMSGTTLNASGGGGSFIANAGSGYRFVNYNAQTIKTIFAGTNITIDSTTNTNGITINASGGGGGGNFVGRDSVVTITSGSSSTVTSGYNIVQFNPSSNLGNYTLTLPTTWHTSNDVIIVFGGTITSGNTVVTLTVNAGSGQTLVVGSALTGQSFAAGEAVRMHIINGQVYNYRIN